MSEAPESKASKRFFWAGVVLLAISAIFLIVATVMLVNRVFG